MRYLLALLAIVFVSCSSPQSVEDVLMNAHPDDYHVVYEGTFGYFVVVHDEKCDTIALNENWLYALYRYRQQEGDVKESVSYDEFLKSKWFCLPGSEVEFELLNKNPDSVYGSADHPTLCECIDENGLYMSNNPICERKFQVYRSSFNDSMSWYYSFYRDVCTGIDSSKSFTAYRDTILTRSQRAEMRLRERQRIEDSIYATYPLVRCSGQDYVPPHMRSSSFRIYEQCRAMTRNPSGKCGRH